jgi:hypothetical protein
MNIHAKDFVDAIADSLKLPDLVVSGSDLNKIAGYLDEMISARDDFLCNGHIPVQVIIADDMPRHRSDDQCHPRLHPQDLPSG